MDVLHQGRAGFPELQQALAARRPYEALLEVGAVGEPGRVANLKAALVNRRARLARSRWSRAALAFV
jgi:hypothetical protein